MNAMVTHSKIVPYNDDLPPKTYYRFAPEDLHPFDRMKCILEQWFFYSYLKEMTTSTSSINSFKDALEVQTIGLPQQLSLTNGALQDMYALGMQLIQQLKDEKYTSTSFMDAYVIFNQPLMESEEHPYHDDKYYYPSMTMAFLVEWFVLLGKMAFKDRYPDEVLYDAALFIPDMVTVQNYDPEKSKEENDDFVLCFNLKAKPIVAFSLKEELLQVHHGLFNMLKRCTFNTGTPLTMEALLGCIASFSIDHDHYVMKLMDPYATKSMVDVCYDLVTGSSFTKSNAGALVDHDTFIQLIQSLIAEGQLLPCQDSELFGALIDTMGADPKVINYFVKPDEAITGEEAFAFRKSVYSTLFADKFIAGMEADDAATEDPTEEETGDDVEETDDANVDSEQEPMSDTEPMSAEEPEKPDIDPDKMLLELAQPNETMADYIYREMVNQRITALLQNPPESARPNDLLMLKRWKTRWLYLTSIACLRDFLSRVSLRLSEV